MGTVDNLYINKIVIIRFLFLSVVLLWKTREIKLSICLQLKMVLLRNINVLSVLMEELLELDNQLRHIEQLHYGHAVTFEEHIIVLCKKGCHKESHFQKR